MDVRRRPYSSTSTKAASKRPAPALMHEERRPAPALMHEERRPAPALVPRRAMRPWSRFASPSRPRPSSLNLPRYPCSVLPSDHHQWIATCCSGTTKEEGVAVWGKPSGRTFLALHRGGGREGSSTRRGKMGNGQTVQWSLSFLQLIRINGHKTYPEQWRAGGYL